MNQSGSSDTVVPRDVASDVALAKLFVDEQTPMLRLATLMVGSVPIAEEVVQDAFTEVTQRWETIDRPGAYLRRCVVTGCAAILRRRPVEARVSHMRSLDSNDELPTHLVELRDALDKLSESQRIVIVLRYFVDVDDHEIAALLEMRPSTVRSHARRGFTVLRRELS